ncbi:CHAT domain-containing protein [Paraburkholderia humisilvae]|uniref:CHAT domain-containing protein n=1 Tax=Paraburkholderia humisilvae TaxID=627669 RepID=UPI0036209452
MCTRDDLRDLGTELWAGLLSGGIKSEVDGVRIMPGRLVQICLCLPPELEQIPWEAVYDIDRAVFLAVQPGYCVLRTMPYEARAADLAAPAPRSGLKLLAVIPEGSGLNVEQELSGLKTAVKQVGNLSFEDLRGRVTPDAVMTKVDESSPDIFHFMGHGELDSDFNVSIRLNSDTGGQNEFLADAEQFAMMIARSELRLGVFNCCYGGRSPRSSLSGLGPLMLRQGVPAIAAMRYPIPDDAAVRFSKAFYGALLTGEHRGRVDFAMQRARYVLFNSATRDQWRTFITPVLYLAQGRESLFDIVPQAPIPDQTQRAVEDVEVPRALLDAFRKRRCIPIVGCGLMRPPTDRFSPAQHTIRALTEHLAQKCQSCDDDLWKAAELAGLTELAFHSVAEVFVAENLRFALIDAIRDWYDNARPSPSHHALATWSVPAIFDTHFDGLLERAFEAAGRASKVIYSLAAPPVDLQSSQEVLVLVRGAPTNDDSLVLTEQENESLLVTMDRLSPSIEQLATAERGRCILLLGVNPRDPVVRKLARRLIRLHSNQGPAFFASSSFTAADRAYWKSLDVTWINAEPDALIDKLTKLMSTEGSAHE